MKIGKPVLLTIGFVASLSLSLSVAAQTGTQPVASNALQTTLPVWFQATLAVIQGLVPAMTAVIGGLWVFHTYLRAQKDAAVAAAGRAIEAANVRRLEAQRPFLEKQLLLYFEAVQVVGKLAGVRPRNSEERAAWRAAEVRYWQLYWSELSMVEDREVESAMATFGPLLTSYSATTNAFSDQSPPQPTEKEEKAREIFQDGALELAHVIAASIAKRWNVAAGYL